MFRLDFVLVLPKVTKSEFHVIPCSPSQKTALLCVDTTRLAC
jgi:hypothetical protein